MVCRVLDIHNLGKATSGRCSSASSSHPSARIEHPDRHTFCTERTESLNNLILLTDTTDERPKTFAQTTENMCPNVTQPYRTESAYSERKGTLPRHVCVWVCMCLNAFCILHPTVRSWTPGRKLNGSRNLKRSTFCGVVNFLKLIEITGSGRTRFGFRAVQDACGSFIQHWDAFRRLPYRYGTFPIIWFDSLTSDGNCIVPSFATVRGMNRQEENTRSRERNGASLVWKHFS